MTEPRAYRNDNEPSYLRGYDRAYDARTDIYRLNQDPRAEEYGFVPGGNPDADKAICGRQQDALRHGEVLYVGEEMCDLLDMLAEGFQPEPLLDSDLLIHSGFAYLASPMTVPTVLRRTDVPLRALAWRRCTDDEVRIMPEKREDGVEIWAYTDAPEYVHGRHLMTGAPLALYEFTVGAVPFGSTPHEAAEQIYAPLEEKVAAGGTDYDCARSASVLLRFQVLMRLCAQRIVEDRPTSPNRAARKRAGRAELPLTDVRVVMLRHVGQRPDRDEPQVVEWSHRWIVKAHWRNQWYPKLGTHRQILVNPYVKGPADKPLVLPRERGFALVR